MTTLTYSNIQTPIDDSYAIPLVTYDTNTTKFVINEEAVAMLKKLDSPLGVITVAGMYRTGKSYLLNRMLLNRSNGFSVGPSINPCTKGLWIWNKPIAGYSPDGSPINVLIIDTEGIGATDEDHNHDNKIITLGILLSSYFLYNSIGTIDENSIQNLSFIVNITKNIQLHNSKKEDIDPRDFAAYLPSFMWVIRDFSLKLIDSEGEPITSKEYLEKSLELQKGYSESVDSKNRIRTLLKEFFRERDCVTLVRPLTDEDNLQNLAKSETNKLRQEFLEQVTQLRKKVMNKVRPKSMNGKILNGEMFFNLLCSYVTAINNGAVPVIENAWSYMCKNECQKAMNNGLNTYTKSMEETATKSFPVYEVDLDKAHKESKSAAIDLFRRTAVGVYVDEFLKEMKSQIREKYLEYTINNEKISRRECEEFLNKNFADIKRTASDGLYKSIAEFKMDIDAFITFYLEKAPAGPQREIFLYKYILKEIIAQSESFLEKNLEEMEQLTNLNTEQIKNLNETLNLTKMELENIQKELMSKNENISKLEKEKSDLVLDGLASKEALSDLVKEKDSCLEKLNEKLEKVTKEYEKQIKALRAKIEQTESNSIERERKAISLEAEFDKQKLLLEQKIKFLEKSLKETTDQHFLEIKSLKKEGATSSKESIERYEQQIKQLSSKLNLIQEKNIDLETKLLEKEKRMENEKIRTEEMIKEYEEKIKDLEKINRDQEQDLKLHEEKFQKEKEDLKLEEETKLKEMKDCMNDQESKFKENENRLSTMLSSAIKELSLVKQSLEFAETQISELKTKIAEDKRNHEIFVKILEDKNTNLMNQYEELTKQINHLKTSYANEIMSLNNKNEAQVSSLRQENEKLTSEVVRIAQEGNRKINELTISNEEKELKLQDTMKKIENYEKRLSELNAMNEELAKSNKFSIDELTNNYNLKIQQILSQCREEMEANNNRNEKIINEIRHHYEIEREALEAKLAQERENLRNQLNEMEIEYEEKLNQMLKSKTERIDELEREVQDWELSHENYVNQTEQELAIKSQQIESLNKFLNDSTQTLNTIQQAHKENLDAQFERFRNEKTQLESKIDNLNLDNNRKEREIAVLITKKDSMENTISDLNKKLSTLTTEYAEEKEELNNKISSLSDKLDCLNKDYMTSKSEYIKEIALKNQEIEFLNQRIAELLKQIQDTEAKLDDKLNANRDNVATEFNKKITILLKEKEDLDTKLNQKKRDIKELEINFNKDKNMLEKEKAVLLEKLSTAMQQKNEMLENLERERESFASKIQNVKNEKKRENEMTMKENEVLKSKLKKLETDYNELSASYEKDRDLWKTKFEHLEEQKNKARSDLTEVQKKFELNLEALQKKTLSEKDKLEQIQKETIANVEERYKSQLKELNQMYSTKLEEMSQAYKQLGLENKFLTDKIISYEKDNSENRTGLEKKLVIAIESETRLKREFKEVVEEKERKIADLTSKYDADRIDWGNKIIELENKLREYEGKRNYLAVDIVKQKAVNDKDKENMENEIQKLKEKILFHERNYVKMMNEHKLVIRENEQLKKTRTPSTSSNSSNIYLPKYQRFMTSNKENRNRSNGSIDKQYESEDLLPIANIKFSSKDSVKGDEDNSNSLII